MIKIWAITAVILNCIIFTIHAHAEATEEQKNNALYRLFTDEFNMKEREQRIITAELINRDCASVFDKIPALSPSEKKWIDKERAADRNSVLDSVEFSMMAAKHHMQRCMSNTSIIMNKSTGEQLELLAWARLATMLLHRDGEFRENQIEQKENIQFSNTEHAVLSLGTLYSQAILDSIIIPLLAN